MLTFEDCLGLCELTKDEIDAIARHEHIPEMAALELGQYLVHSPGGAHMIKGMIIDDIDDARRHKDMQRMRHLKLTLKHFVHTHPDNPKAA